MHCSSKTLCWGIVPLWAAKVHVIDHKCMQTRLAIIVCYKHAFQLGT